MSRFFDRLYLVLFSTPLFWSLFVVLWISWLPDCWNEKSWFVWLFWLSFETMYIILLTHSWFFYRIRRKLLKERLGGWLSILPADFRGPPTFWPIAICQSPLANRLVFGDWRIRAFDSRTVEFENALDSSAVEKIRFPGGGAILEGRDSKTVLWLAGDRMPEGFWVLFRSLPSFSGYEMSKRWVPDPDASEV